MVTRARGRRRSNLTLAPMTGWERLAQAIRGESGRHYTTLRDLADSAGLSHRTVEELAAGRRTGYRDSTLYRIEAALGWSHGSALRIVHGGRPIRGQDPALARFVDNWDGLTVRDRGLLSALLDAMLQR